MAKRNGQQKVVTAELNRIKEEKNKGKKEGCKVKKKHNSMEFGNILTIILGGYTNTIIM